MAALMKSDSSRVSLLISEVRTALLSKPWGTGQNHGGPVTPQTPSPQHVCGSNMEKEPDVPMVVEKQVLFFFELVLSHITCFQNRIFGCLLCPFPNMLTI